MKKIFTLLIVAFIGTSSFAQSHDNDFDNRRGNNNTYNDWTGSADKHYNERRYSRMRELMEAEIAGINREYNRKVSSVKNNCFMTSFRKQRVIRSLESQRRDEINAVYVKFNGMRSDYGYNGSRH